MTTGHGKRQLAATPGNRSARGYTLTELLVVVVLLGLAAVIVTPTATVADGRKLDLMATEIANAMRFARSEALRTGEARGVFHQKGALRIRVFSFEPEVLPPTFNYDVYHPVDRQLYVREFSNEPYSFDGVVTNSLKYRDVCARQQAFFFDAEGVAWCTDPTSVLMDSFEVTLTLGNQSRVITVQGINGRVTVQ